MKTLAIFSLAILLSNINLKADNKIEGTTARTSLKQYVTFQITPREVINQVDNTMIAEIERKDLSKIAFRTNIQEVTQSAFSTNLDELDSYKAVSFRLELKDVVNNIKMDLALYELAVAEFSFKLSIHDVLNTLANTDTSVFENETAAIQFTLNAPEVEKYAKSVRACELVAEESCLAVLNELQPLY